MGFTATDETGCGIDRDRACDARLPVPGGAFLRGYDPASDGHFNHADSPATVSPFVLDTYEVTVGRFRAFVDAGFGTQVAPPPAGSGAHPNTAGTGWSSENDPNLLVDRATLSSALACDGLATWSDEPGRGENRAMSCVSWYEAFAFCIQEGGYLPSEAEWSFAASAGDQQRAYPWSAPADDLSIDCDHAVYGPCALATGPTVPGSVPLGDGAYGHADLAGNVGEWTLDQYDLFVSPCNDCVATASTGANVTHGGAYQFDAIVERVGYRAAFNPNQRYPTDGFRCAYPP